MNKELKNRIRENKYLTRNETDFIIKALEENSSLHEQVNMWQSEHAKRVLELGKLHESIKQAREEIYNLVDFSSPMTPEKQTEMFFNNKVLNILDELIESEEKNK